MELGRNLGLMSIKDVLAAAGVVMNAEYRASLCAHSSPP
jgi:hypothetical protein